jgi:hypothetical protein
MTDPLTIKLALLAEWEYLCHDDFEDGVDWTGDQYWEFLEEQTPEDLHLIESEEFHGKRTADMVLGLYKTYLSPKHFELTNEKARTKTAESNGQS